MKLLLILLCIIFLIRVQCKNIHFDKDNVLVTIEQGSLLGRETKDWKNDTYYTFEGIPYAKPPVGTLRFKAPEPPEPWTGIYNATKSREICPQTDLFATVEGDVYSEDCLFLNVYTKMSTKLQPVMVYIHGGAFDYGSIQPRGNETRGNLLAEGVVVVDVQYRLNIFGFLSFDDPKYDIRGNAGLKDQVMGLKWVQKNIAHFGGDPNQVTIFGESAGGASIHLLYVSPLTKGLFHRAISQSGSGANTWVHSENKYPQLAAAMNCSLSTLDEMVKCINGSTTEELLRAVPILQTNPNNTLAHDQSMNVLTIEMVGSKDPFLTEPVEDIVRQGKFNKVPIIMGICANESAAFATTRRVGPDFNESNYEALIPADLNIVKGSDLAFNIGKQIKEFYYGDQTPSKELMDPYVRYLSDLMFIQKIYHIATVQAKAEPDIPLYFYNFNYLTELNFNEYHVNNSDNYVYHADDVKYLFSEVDAFGPESNEYIGHYRMIKLWTNFAKSKNGDPNSYDDPLFNGVVWKPITSESFSYLHINPNLKLQENLYVDRMTFWDNLYRQYNENY